MACLVRCVPLSHIGIGVRRSISKGLTKATAIVKIAIAHKPTRTITFWPYIAQVRAVKMTMVRLGGEIEEMRQQTATNKG